MEYVRMLLEHQPMMALFLTIAIGYVVGEINLKGFSLGVGAVLFVTLAVGWLAPQAAPAAMVGTLGLALFLYTVGIQSGHWLRHDLSRHDDREDSLRGYRPRFLQQVGEAS